MPAFSKACTCCVTENASKCKNTEINCKALNEDPAGLNVESHKRCNQPNLKTKTMISQRLLQGRYNVMYLKQYFGWPDQPYMLLKYKNKIIIIII